MVKPYASECPNETGSAFPAYISVEEQEEIKAILKRNDFSKQYRPGHGSALCQGLLYCACCGDRLMVAYHRKDGHSYWCGASTIQAGKKPCSYFDGKDLDRAIEKAVLSALGAPPLELLRKRMRNQRGWARPGSLGTPGVRHELLT